MKLCPEGWPFVLGSGGVDLAFAVLAHSTGNVGVWVAVGILFVFTVFCAYFFRDPQRTLPLDDQRILSPADGKILDIAQEKHPETGDPMHVIRIFLSVFEPHLQRSPIRGHIKTVLYKPGKFLDARDPRAPFENEQNWMDILPVNKKINGRVTVTQIAGLIARRIVCDFQSDRPVNQGQRLGLIRFGSQVDIAFPTSLKLTVKLGDFVQTGLTTLAEVL